MERVWPGAIVNKNTLQMHISAVRKAPGPRRAMLKTESGRGYRLVGTCAAQDQGLATVVASQQLRVFEKLRHQYSRGRLGARQSVGGRSAIARSCLCLSGGDPDGAGAASAKPSSPWKSL
jgi:hypothetical protein